MSNSVGSGETAHWAVSSGSKLFAKAIIIACSSERVNTVYKKKKQLAEHKNPNYTAQMRSVSEAFDIRICVGIVWRNAKHGFACLYRDQTCVFMH